MQPDAFVRPYLHESNLLLFFAWLHATYCLFQAYLHECNLLPLSGLTCLHEYNLLLFFACLHATYCLCQAYLHECNLLNLSGLTCLHECKLLLLLSCLHATYCHCQALLACMQPTAISSYNALFAMHMPHFQALKPIHVYFKRIPLC